LSKLITKEEADNRLLKKHNGNIKLLRYVNMSDYATFECQICNYKWEATAKSVITNGNGCPECRKVILSEKHSFSYDYIKEYIESFDGYKLLSDKYVNNKIKLEIKCSKGHVFPMSFDCFRRGHRCPTCQQIKHHLSQRVPNKIFKLLEENEFEFIEFPDGYINRKSIIVFKCKLNHTSTKAIKDFLKRPTCTECTKIKVSESQRGSKGNGWKGGITYLSSNIKPMMIEWKQESMKNCNYKCVITGKHFNDIHHLYSFHLILEEAIKELSFNLKLRVGDYTNEELIVLTNKVKELHNKYPLGICLCKKIHDLFHKFYGFRNNTPEQFTEFTQRYYNFEFDHLLEEKYKYKNILLKKTG
jgi:hypothetical protein